MTIKERIQNLCKSHNISMNYLEAELGFGKGYISKLGKSTPNTNNIKKIADYFGVSVDYVMNGVDDSNKSVYYLNDEAAAIAQEMYEDPDMRTLFDMKKNISPEIFETHMKFMKELYNKEHPSD